MNLKKHLEDLNACREASHWVGERRSLREAWMECPRADWLVWYASHAGIDPAVFVPAMFKCLQLFVETLEEGITKAWMKLELERYQDAEALILRCSTEEIRVQYAEGNAVKQEHRALLSSAENALRHACLGRIHGSARASSHVLLKITRLTNAFEGTDTLPSLIREHLPFEQLAVPKDAP